jgi:hypothetical protein
MKTRSAVRELLHANRQTDSESKGRSAEMQRGLQMFSFFLTELNVYITFEIIIMIILR